VLLPNEPALSDEPFGTVEPRGYTGVVETIEEDGWVNMPVAGTWRKHVFGDGSAAANQSNADAETRARIQENYGRLSKVVKHLPKKGSDFNLS
jgi:hypothetical protein